MKFWKAQNPNPITSYGNPEKTEHRFSLTFNTKPDLIRWGVLFGDAIHNLRAALDNVVWLVAARDMAPREPKRTTQFPIFIDRDVYFGKVKGNRSGLSQIGSVKDPNVRAIIERAQPWQHSQSPNQDHLWVVHEFNREDKHRVITDVLFVPRQIESALVIEYADPAKAIPPIILANNAPLEDGAEFLAIHTPTPPKRVEMEGHVTFGIGITMSGQTGGLTGTLGELCKHTRGVVEEILDCLV